MSATFKMHFQVDGTKVMIQAIKRDGAVLVQRFAEDIAELTTQIVPIDTGALQATIDEEKINYHQWRVIAGNEDVDYAMYVEHGTTKMAAQPFLTPATDAHKERYFSEVARLINESAREASGK